MYFERQKKIQEKINQELQRFFNSLKLTIPTQNNKCLLLVQAVNIYLHQKIKNPIFQNILLTFDHSKDVPKTKSRLCGGILKKGDRAYKCHDCITEQNSIICLGCFEADKHKGHQFELISVFGGCCDCGDQQKWKKDGFCKQHSGDFQMQILLNEQLLQIFIEEQHFGFKILLVLYQSYLQEIKFIQQIKLQGQIFDQSDHNQMRESIKKKIIAVFQIYSNAYFKQLIDFNICGQYANSMTSKLFQSNLNLQNLPPVQSSTGETNFFKLLFKLVMFDKAADRVCDLCITLFQLNKFRQALTVQYIDNYINSPGFSNSYYSHLSSQLFTSYLAISKLVKQRKIPPLLVYPIVKSQKDLNDSAQAFVRYYYDLFYISKLFGSASIQYFHYHAEEGKVVEFGDYRRLYNEYPKAIDYYGLEEIFVNRLLNTVRVMQREPSLFIMKSSLRQLYHFISNYQNKTDNYFRPQQRLFTMITFAYLNGDINKLDNQQTMIEYLAIIGVNQLQREVKSIISNICTVLSFAAHLLQNQAKITQHFTFYSYYFKKNQKLFNLDAILLKIIIKICQFHNKNASQQINYSSMIKNGDKYYHIINKMQAYSNGFDNIHNLFTAKQNNLPLGQEYLKHFTLYISLLNQAIVSDLPLLAIKCFMHPTKQQISKYRLPQINYKEQAYHYYQNILKSCENKTISIKQFKTICEVFFKEEQIFKNFVDKHMDTFDSRKLNAQKSKGQKMSLIHMRSMSVRAKGIDNSGTFTYLPYYKISNTIDFLREDMVDLSKKSVQYLQNLQKLLQVQNVSNYKAVIENCYTNLFNIIWVVYLQTNQQELYTFITNTLQRQSIKQYLGIIAKQVRNYSKVQNKNQIQVQSKESIAKKELLKQKQSNKKNLMKQKMNKTKDLFIQNQPIQSQHQQFCCICKSTKQDEEICYVAMMSQTNYNNWVYLSPQNHFYSITMCGHLVHKTCYKQTIKRNQIYSFCPLCKTPMNIILPQVSKSSFQQSYLQFIQQFHKIVKIYNPHTQRIKQGRILYLSLVTFVVIRGLLFPHIFKKYIRAYQALSHLLIQFIKINTHLTLYDEDSELINVKLLKDSDLTIKHIFKYCSQAIFQKISSFQRQHQESSLSPQFRSFADKLISDLFNQDTLESTAISQFKQIEQIRCTIAEPHIQIILSELSSKHVGKCPNCSLVTNQQAKCLICPNFVTCIKCQKIKLMTHASIMHKNTASFIKTFNGQVVYIFRNRFWIFQSIFQDYIGRIYQAGNLKKSDYKLNTKKYEQFHDDVINISIQSRLRYKQKESNKVNHDQQL